MVGVYERKGFVSTRSADVPPEKRTIRRTVQRDVRSFFVYTPFMTLMLLGDSLSAGNLGIPYSRYLSFSADSRIANHGIDGDTLRGVLLRIENALNSDKPDAVLLGIGGNDILLPKMAARGGTWTAFVEEMIASGAVPTSDPEEFETLFARLIRVSADAKPERIIVTTIPPLGENLESPWNRLRENLNRRIRRVAAAAGKDENPAVRLADTANAFEEVLRQRTVRSDWFFGDPKDFITDKRRMRREKGAVMLSEERGLYLTMDGVHFNERGAELFAGVVNKTFALRSG